MFPLITQERVLRLWECITILWKHHHITRSKLNEYQSVFGWHTLWQKCWVVIAKTSMHSELFPSWVCRVMICLACCSQRSFSPCIARRRSRSASSLSGFPPRRATHDFWRTDTQSYKQEVILHSVNLLPGCFTFTIQ